MQTFIDLITATFAAGETKIFEMSGGYFELIDAPYPVTVELSDRYGGLAGKMTNAEASFFIASDYSRITLTSATAQTIRFGYGSGTVGNRKTAGVVQVIDGELARSKAGLAFIAPIVTAAVAAQFQGMELWNPAGSGRRLVVSDYSHSSPSAAGVTLNRITTTIGAALLAQNKSNIGSAGVARIGSASQAAVLGQTLEIYITLASSPFMRTFKQPLIIEPNSGISLSNGTPNVSFYGSIQFTEEVI